MHLPVEAWKFDLSEAGDTNTAFLSTCDDWRKRSYPLGVLLVRWSISLQPILLALTAYVYRFEASFGPHLTLSG
jgi:hypothetical protein